MPSMVSIDKSVRLGDVLDGFDETCFASPDELDVIPANLKRGITLEIAERWQVPDRDIRLRWGVLASIGHMDDRTGFRLVGRGTDSWFAIVFRNPGEPGTAIRLRAGVTQRIPVATGRLAAGGVVGEEDIAYRKAIHWGPIRNGLYGVVEPGWRIVRDLDEGDDLVPPAVVPELTVRQGDSIRLRWQRGVVRVGLTGTALHDASTGERITVKLRGGRGISYGTVTGSGEANLDA